MTRATRLHQPPSWITTVEHILAWDRRVHTALWNPTMEWALLLRDRLIIWLLLLCGLRGTEVIALRLTGSHPTVLRGATGLVTALGVPRPALGRGQQRTIVVGEVRGLAELLQRYVESARPLIRWRNLPQADTLLLDSRGLSFSAVQFNARVRQLLASAIFDERGVTLYHLRRAAFGLLVDGLRLPLPTVASMLGCRLPALALFSQPHDPAPAFSLAAQPTEADRVVSELRAWLGRIAEDLGPASTS